MNEDRRRIRERLKRLREMTASRGCTEAEALAAAEKAAQLMRDHGITAADLEIEEASSPTRQAGHGMKARLWPVISFCTNTASIVVRDDDGADLTFVGREPGPAIAVYLWDVCERAIDRELVRFKSSTPYRRKRKLTVKRQMAAAFVIGMILRLSERLKLLFEPSIDVPSREAAKAALVERYPDSLVLRRPRAKVRHVEAVAAGLMAGDKVTLAHGVNAAGAPLQIGGASR